MTTAAHETAARLQREAAIQSAHARWGLHMLPTRKDNLFETQKREHAARIYQDEAAHRAARSRRLMGIE